MSSVGRLDLQLALLPFCTDVLGLGILVYSIFLLCSSTLFVLLIGSSDLGF